MNSRFDKRIGLTPEMLQKIARIDELKGLWRGSAKLNPHILKQLKMSVIITSTGASTRIEGARMSDEEVARLIRGLKTKPPKGRDAEEVAGYADLLGRIFDNYKTLKLTEGQIWQFHGILLHFSSKDQLGKGKYKSSDNIVVARDSEGKEVVLFRPTPPYLVKKEMDDVFAWTNAALRKKTTHPILIIANFIFEFLAIHPFHDGNGRLSRALTNLLLLQLGYAYVPCVSLEEIIENQKDAYYLSLRGAQRGYKTEQEDITTWILFLLDVLLKQAELAREIIEGDRPEKMLSGKQIQVLNLFEENMTLAPKQISALLRDEVPLPTIKQILARLTQLHLIRRIGLGRATRYSKQ
ncbi:MAG: Fic family protein [Parcubacteria group bacterium Gr01-1014_66]|nr:MAG: Fic family protein [Parcubacteria group bacterium Gr01-1014_66]